MPPKASSRATQPPPRARVTGASEAANSSSARPQRTAKAKAKAKAATDSAATAAAAAAKKTTVPPKKKTTKNAPAKPPAIDTPGTQHRPRVPKPTGKLNKRWGPSFGPNPLDHSLKTSDKTKKAVRFGEQIAAHRARPEDIEEQIEDINEEHNEDDEDNKDDDEEQEDDNDKDNKLPTRPPAEDADIKEVNLTN